MSAGAQIDYDGLAKKYGATSSKAAAVDYDSLARQYGATSSVAPSQPTSQDPSFGQKALGVGSDLLQGVGEGALQTVATVSKGLNKFPWVGEYLAPKEGIAALSKIATPDNLTQRVGAAGEQALEIAATAGPLRKGAVTLAGRLPFLGRFAAPAARIGAEALNTGANAALHGQSAGTGAALGAASGGLTEGLQAVAPKLAESALGVTQRLRGRGRNIGGAILDETSGFRPSTIAQQSQSRLSDLNSQLENAAAQATQGGQIAKLKPATDIVDSELAKAYSRNAAPTVAKLQALKDQLTTDLQTGNPFNGQVSPSKLLDLKRGVGELVNSWSVEERKGLQKVLPRVYGALDAELDRVVPESQQLNQRMSSLIPAKQRANIVANNASIPQRMAGRLAAHTGALAASSVGGYEGYRQGGVPGAVLGGAAGLAIPEALASPTTQMIAARTAAGGLPRLLPFLRGFALQSQDQGGDEGAAGTLPWRRPKR